MNDSDDRHGPAARLIRVLQCVAEGNAVFSLQDLAAQVALPASTAHRLLQVLVATGLVDRAGDKDYRIGLEFFRIGSLVLGKINWGEIAHPYLMSLWSEWQETCSFCRYSSANRTALVVQTIKSPHPLQYVVEPYTELPLPWGSMGRSILAFLGPDVIDSVLTQTGRGPLSGRPPPARAMLRQELLEIKERGYAIYLDPEYIHAAGVAAPVYDASGQVLGCLGVSMPYSRFQSAMAETMGLSIVGQANQLSDLLRGKGLRG